MSHQPINMLRLRVQGSLKKSDVLTSLEPHLVNDSSSLRIGVVDVPEANKYDEGNSESSFSGSW